MGAPQTDAAKYDRLHKTSFQYFFSISGNCFIKRRLETPLRLFTNFAIDVAFHVALVQRKLQHC